MGAPARGARPPAISVSRGRRGGSSAEDVSSVITALLPRSAVTPSPRRTRMGAQGWSGGMARLARYNAPSAERRRASTVRPSAG
jgi:hypothetical protein